MTSKYSFNSWRAFSEFEKEVCQSNRYIRTDEAERFLSAVRYTSMSRPTKISKGSGLWRAQVGHEWRHVDEIDDKVPCAFPADRMKPLRDRAQEGRANPKGIPILYLCSSKHAAMSEVRPWIGSMISLGLFETTRDLKLVNCTLNSDEKPTIYFETPPQNEWTNIVWSEINRAFTTPVTRSDDVGDYVATQILSELFKSEGFDGIAYKSAFGESSRNIALFDLDSVQLRSCQLHEATQVKLNFRERDEPYWVRRAVPKTKST